LSEGQISALFTIWSATAILAEVPTGVLADRFSRRASLVAAGLLQAAGYAGWALSPGFAGYAGGFVLWGVGGALVSGAFEALLYDGLAAAGARDNYASVLGRVSAAGLVGQLPAAGAATVLFAAGGFRLVTWVSVGCCLAAAGLATRLPEAPSAATIGEDDDAEVGFLATLRAGLGEIGVRPTVRRAVLAVAILSGVDAIDEYTPLLARDWGVPTALNPLATLAIPLVGAAGAALGGAAVRLGNRRLALVLGVAALTLGAAGVLRRPSGLAAVAAFYGLYQLVLVVADARLQERIDTASRATVASVAGLGTEVSVFGLYAAWAAGGVIVIAALVLVLAAAVPYLLRTSGRGRSGPRAGAWRRPGRPAGRT